MTTQDPAIHDLKSKLTRRIKALRPSPFKIFTEHLFITILIAIDLWLLQYIYNSLKNDPGSDIFFDTKLDILDGLNKTSVIESGDFIDRAQLEDIKNLMKFAEENEFLPSEITELFRKFNVTIDVTPKLYSETVSPAKFAKLNRLAKLYLILRTNLHRSVGVSEKTKLHQSNIDLLTEAQTKMETERLNNINSTKIHDTEKRVAELKSTGDAIDAEIAELQSKRKTYLESLRANTPDLVDFACKSIIKERDELEKEVEGVMLELDRVEKAGNAEAKKTVNKKRMEKQGLLDKAESRVTECKEQAGTKSKNLNDAELAEIFANDPTIQRDNTQIEIATTKKKSLQDEIDYYQGVLQELHEANKKREELAEENFNKLELEREALRKCHVEEARINDEVQKPKKNYLDYLDVLIRD